MHVFSWRGYGPGLKDVNGGHSICDNEIHDGGLFFRSRPGIFIWQSGENLVANNCIYRFHYNGITISGVRPRYFKIPTPGNWLWSQVYDIPDDLRENKRVIRWPEVAGAETWGDVIHHAHARNNLVEENEIHDVMVGGGDGDGI